MKNLFNLKGIAVIGALSLLVSCAIAPEAGSSSQGDAVIDVEGLTTGANVQLVWAKMSNSSDPLMYHSRVTLYGEVKVKNIAYTKNIWIHVYCLGTFIRGSVTNSGVWNDVACTYVRAAESGYEIWKFSVTQRLYKGGQGSYPFFKHTYKYTVNGATYWDNNNNKNYADGHLDTQIKLYQSDYSTASHPSLYTMNHILKGEVLVENLAYSKQVMVRYFGSDSQWHDVAATYSRPSYTYGNYEFWSFNIVTPVYKYPPTGFYKFCLYTVQNGVTTWDNNGGANYTGTVSNNNFGGYIN